MDIVIAVIAWYVTGFIAVSWSYYWKMDEDDVLDGLSVAIAGAFLIPTAIRMRKEYKDLR